MDKIQIVKGVIKFVAGAGVGAVVQNAIRATTPEDISIISKVLVGIGELIIVGLLSDKGANYVMEQIDDAFGHKVLTEEK